MGTSVLSVMLVVRIILPAVLLLIIGSLLEQRKVIE